MREIQTPEIQALLYQTNDAKQHLSRIFALGGV